MSNSDTESIGLADFIQQVRAEIVQSGADAGSDIPLFAVTELEVTIGVTVEKRAEGSLSIKVVQVGAGAAHSAVHSVTVKLLPLLTLEERREELQKDPRWGQTVKTLVKSTLKGSSREPAAEIE